MEIENNYLLLTETAKVIWASGEKEGEDKMFGALYKIREGFFRGLIYSNSPVSRDMMRELAETAFLKAWEDFNTAGKAGKNIPAAVSYAGYFSRIVYNKFWTLHGKELLRLKGEVQFGGRHADEGWLEFELKGPGILSPRTEAVFKKITPDCPQMLLWKYVTKLSHEEIARRKNFKVETSRQTVSRCRDRFIKLWFEEGENFN